MTKVEAFKRYLKVQMSGVYNMITEAQEAADMAGLSEEEYWDVIKHYSEYKALAEKGEER